VVAVLAPPREKACKGIKGIKMLKMLMLINGAAMVSLTSG
jgi:hypothetical protein